MREVAYSLLAEAKYSLDEVGSGLMVALFFESSQLAGQTSPCSSVTVVRPPRTRESAPDACQKSTRRTATYTGRP